MEREVPAVEVPEKPVRRRFSTEYKIRILAEADGCTELGQLGELLRREGLYSSLLSTWRRQRDEGVLAGLSPKRRGRKAKPKTPLADKNERLQRENERLKEKLRQAELIIDVQKKVSEMLNIPLKTPDENEVE
jgi:transposase-like protein